MAKIMLVEDDNNLREIYEARLLAEGYEIVSAEDGEQALAMAVKEKPDLIISDIMMPKISGFDMLDILRSTPETKHTKIIMMTALSQAEDRERADKLGADKYLVKSQVTLEDVANVAKEVLQDDDVLPATVLNTPAVVSQDVPTASPTSGPASTSTTTTPSSTIVAPTTPANPTPIAITDDSSQTQAPPQATSSDPVVAPNPTNSTATSTADSTNAASSTAATMASTVNNLLQNDSVAPASSNTAQTNEAVAPLSDNHIAGKKVISPINDIKASSGPDLNALLAKEIGQTPPVVTDTQPSGAQPEQVEVSETPNSSKEDDAPIAVPLPGNVQTPENLNDPNNIAL